MGLGVVLIAMVAGLMTAQPILVFQLWIGAAAKILSTESLGGQLGNVVLPDANKVRSGINFGVLGGVTGTYEGPPLPPSNLLSTDVSNANKYFVELKLMQRAIFLS